MFNEIFDQIAQQLIISFGIGAIVHAFYNGLPIPELWKAPDPNSYKPSFYIAPGVSFIVDLDGVVRDCRLCLYNENTACRSFTVAQGAPEKMSK